MADPGVPLGPTAASPPTDDDIDISTPAFVTWGVGRSLSEATFDVRRIGSTSDAFLKLRTTVLFKASTPRKTPVFLFIHPERIRAIVLGEPEADQEIHHEEACKMLSTDTVCLRFVLSRPVDLVGPGELLDLTPKNKASGETLDSLRSLACQEDFVVYFPRNALSQARLVSLCGAASSGALKSIARHADLASLYRGKGGRVIIVHSDAPDDVAAGPSNPPSYDELEPSPPLAPLDASSSGKTPMPSAISRPDVLTCVPGQASKKRRRDSLDDVASGRRDPLDIERMCRKIVEEQKAEMLKAVEAQQDKLYERLLTDLKPYIGQELKKMETRILEQVEERAGKQAEEREEHLEQRLEQTKDEVNDVMESRVGDVDEKVEDEFYGLRLRLEDFVREEVAEAEDRIVEHLESSATISLSFS